MGEYTCGAGESGWTHDPSCLSIERPRPEGAAQKFTTHPPGTWPHAESVPRPTAEQVLTAEQVKALQADLNDVGPLPLDDAVAVLASHEDLRRRLDAAEQERVVILAALGEPCAECGHVDWRSDGASDYYSRVEAAEAEVARLTEAMGTIADVAEKPQAVPVTNEWYYGVQATVLDLARAALGSAGSPAEKGTGE